MPSASTTKTLDPLAYYQLRTVLTDCRLAELQLAQQQEKVAQLQQHRNARLRATFTEILAHVNGSAFGVQWDDTTYAMTITLTDPPHPPE